MVASILNLTMEKDRTFSESLQVFNDVAGEALNLTGYSIKMQVRPLAGSPILYLELSTTNGRIVIDSPPTQGRCSLLLTAAETNALTFSQGDYDLIFISPGGVVTEIVEGTITVLPRVTVSV